MSFDQVKQLSNLVGFHLTLHFLKIQELRNVRMGEDVVTSLGSSGPLCQPQGLAERAVNQGHLACGHRAQVSVDHAGFDRAQYAGHDGGEEESGFLPGRKYMISEEHPGDVACNGGDNDLLAAPR